MPRCPATCAGSTIRLSATGLALLGIYAALYACVFYQYEQSAKTWMDDLGLNLLCLPYVLLVRLLTGDSTFDLAFGTHFGGFWLPALCCAALAYAIGAGAERIFKRSKPLF